MLNNRTNLQRAVITTIELLKADGQNDIVELISSSEITTELEYSGYDGNHENYDIHISTPVSTFVKHKDAVTSIENVIKKNFEILLRGVQTVSIGNVYITPKPNLSINWNLLYGDYNDKDSLISDITKLKDQLIATATGTNIQSINESYIYLYRKVNKTLRQLSVANPNPFLELWEWYHFYKNRMSTYDARRIYIRNLYNDLLDILNEKVEPELLNVNIDLTGWDRISRSIREIKVRYDQAETEEQFQGLGLLSRETIISLAQQLFDEAKHPISDGTKVSPTDAKRMLEAYISVELTGKTNENLRKYAKATLDLANELIHKRTAAFKDAALCSSATISLVNIFGIIEGRHD